MKQNKFSYALWHTVLPFITLTFVLVLSFFFETISKYQLLGLGIVYCAFLSVYLLFPARWNVIVFFLFNGLLYFYNMAQKLYYEAFGDYFRLAMVLSMKSEIKGSMDSIKEYIRLEYFIPLLFLAIVSILYFLLHKRRNISQLKIKLRLGLALVSVVAYFAGYHVLKSKLETTRENVDGVMLYQTDYYVYYSMPSTTQFVKKFGFSNLLMRETEMFLEASEVEGEYRELVEAYMLSREDQTENDYTGLFKGKSVLFVQAESLMNLAIDEKLTPTLYQIVNEGITVHGYNSPLMSGSTSATEFLVNTSLFPLTDDGYNASMKYMNNEFPNTLPNYFSDMGYSTYGFHNNYAEFYSRDLVFSNYGYDYFYDCSALGLDSHHADSNYFEGAKWILLEKEQFLGYWITFNGHQPYDFSFPEEVAQYVSLVKETYPELSDEYVSYFAKNMDLDRTLQYFINNCKELGREDEIVIVLFGDHYAKGLQDEEVTRNALSQMGKDSSSKYVNDALKTPLSFYLPSSDLSSLSINKLSNTVDILPTVCNLWGIELEEAKHLGFDIFDDQYDGFSFDATSIYETNSFVYDYVSGDFEKKNTDISNQEIMEEIDDIVLRFEVSKHLLEMDYFKEKE